MRIMFVRPRPSNETIGLQHLMVVEPLELEVLAALKRSFDEVIVVDMILESMDISYFIEKYNPELFCVTGYISNVNTMISYCSTAKKIVPGVKTIVGGVHCEVCPEDLDHPSIDFRVIRNPALVFTQILEHIDGNDELPKGVLLAGEIVNENELPDFDFSVPRPDRKVVERYKDQYFYIFHNKVELIKTSFGCPYTCSFCFCRIITKGKYYQRSVEDVIEELSELAEKEIYIVDDDFLVDKKWLELFVRLSKEKKLNKHYLVYGRADFIANHPVLMHELSQIGLKTVIVGFESFSDEELADYNKKTDVQLYRKTMDVLHRENIDCYATIIVPPQWKKSDFNHMIRTIRSLGIYFVNLQPLTPLPKTGVEYPDDQLLINRKEYEKWDLAHISIRPDHMSVADFYNEILRAYFKILYRPKAIWKYLVSYDFSMLIRMLKGGYKVSKQYRRKIKEAKKNA